MSQFDTAALTTAIAGFAAKIKQIAEDSAFAENSAKLEGLTLNEVVELIAGTTGLTIQDVQDSLDTFIARTDNPHAVTAEQVGLGSVDNFATATKAQAAGTSFDYTATDGQTAFTGADIDAEVLELSDGAIVYVEKNGTRVPSTDFTVDVANDTVTLTTGAALDDLVSIRVVAVDKFMTPDVLWHVLDVFWGNKVGAAPATLDTIDEIAAAIANNADAVTAINDAIATRATTTQLNDAVAALEADIAALTKADIGLGLVDNYATATTQEGIDGVATDKFMTPATTKSAIDTAIAAVNSSVENLTKADVGLDLVENYAIATEAQALVEDLGTSTNTAYMTPLRTLQVRKSIEADVTTALADLETAFNDAIAALDETPPA